MYDLALSTAPTSYKVIIWLERLELEQNTVEKTANMDTLNHIFWLDFPGATLEKISISKIPP